MSAGLCVVERKTTYLKGKSTSPEKAMAAVKERPLLFSQAMVRALLDGTKTQTRRIVKCPPHYQIEEADDGRRWPWMYDGERDRDHWLLCPYGAPGEKLWVREAWAPLTKGYAYRADPSWNASPAGRWRPSIHMPRAASRITLEVTDVRVERLQDITRGEAMAEGCPFPNMALGPDPRQWYAELWDQINGPGAWEFNPWVWVVSFKVIKP